MLACGTAVAAGSVTETVVTEEMCAEKRQQAVDANGEQAPKAEPIDDDSMTCRICLSDYKVGRTENIACTGGGGGGSVGSLGFE